MNWEKLGHVYVAAGERDWQQSWAYCPTPLSLGDGRIRVYCAFLDESKVGRAGWVDVAEDDPTKVIGVSPEPVLDVGRPGTFDDNGVTPLSVVRLPDGRVWLYYAGWQLGVQVRYYLFAGLAESRDGGETFRRVQQVPVLDRSDAELHLRTGVFVRSEADRFRMWYVGGSDWVDDERTGLQKPRYSLLYAESADGIHWPSQGQVCLSPRNDDELGFGRPYVIVKDGRHHMWYSNRTLSKGYRIAYAVSEDGVSWERQDGAGIDVSEAGWDSKMIGLSGIYEAEDRLYLFYNGNGYGETGFGVAVTDGAL